MIGDFGMTIYFGRDQRIKDHLRRCLEIDYQIFEFAQVGRRLRDVAGFADKLLTKYGLTNQVTSTTDKTGVNIGHDVPASFEPWDPQELEVLRRAEADWQAVCDVISKKRHFVNKEEKLIIQPGMSLTDEARLTVVGDESIPMASYHTIIQFDRDGRKNFLTNFDDIFRLVSMDYMLS